MKVKMFALANPSKPLAPRLAVPFAPGVWSAVGAEVTLQTALEMDKLPVGGKLAANESFHVTRLPDITIGAPTTEPEMRRTMDDAGRVLPEAQIQSELAFLEAMMAVHELPPGGFLN